MKQYNRLVIVAVFILLLLHISYAHTDVKIQESINHGNVNFAEVGDIDGNGKDDLVFISGQDGTLSTGVWFSRGNTFDDHVIYDLTTWNGTIGGMIFVEDVNGDSRDDIIFVVENGSNLVTVFISNGDGTFLDAETQQINLDGFDIYRIYGGDVDGDQRFDLIFKLITTNSSENIVYIMRGQPNGLFQTMEDIKS